MNPQETSTANRTFSNLGGLPQWISDSISVTGNLGKLVYALGLPMQNFTDSLGMLNAYSLYGNNYPCLVGTALLEDPYEVDTVTYTASGYTPVTLQCASSQYEFLTSTQPSYIVDTASSTILIRNMYQTQETVTPSGNIYQLTAADILDCETIGVVQDGLCFALPEEFIDRNTGRICTGKTDEAATFVYSTQTLLDLVTRATITVNDEDTYSVTLASIWTPKDEQALITGISRNDMESNSDLEDRIRLGNISAYMEAPYSNLYSVANELSLTRSITWSSSGSLTVESDEGSVTSVTINSLPRIKLIKENLTPNIYRTVFYATYKEWEDTYYIYRDGIKIDDDSMVVSGGILTTAKLDGTVSALYQIATYDVVYSDGKAIITPTANTPPGEYEVIYTIGISTSEVDPTNPLLISDAIKCGRASWNAKVTWLDSDTSRLKYTAQELL